MWKPLRWKDAFGGPDAAGNAAPKTQGVRALAMSPSADGGNARVGGFLNSQQVEPGAGRELFVGRNATQAASATEHRSVLKEERPAIRRDGEETPD